MFLMFANIHLANTESQEAGTTDVVFDCFLNSNNRKKTIVLINIVNFVRFTLSWKTSTWACLWRLLNRFVGLEISYT